MLIVLGEMHGFGMLGYMLALMVQNIECIPGQSCWGVFHLGGFEMS